MHTKEFISEIITGDEFALGRFNVIASGTGTGKTEFVRRTLLGKFTDLHPSEILYVTSRSMTRDQQAELDGIERLGHQDENIIRYWNGEVGELKEIRDAGIWIMNYNQLVHILDYWNPEEGNSLQKIKLAVFDECHALFSDDFISGMGIARQWIRERIRDQTVMLIGMTATQGIINHNSSRFGNKMKTVNDKYIINYKAKHLICTTHNNLYRLLTDERFTGKTIIMCQTIRDCKNVNAYIHNSVMLVSINNKSFTDEMKILRDYIIANEKLPEDTSIFGKDYPRGVHPIDVLITTTSMREGINLRDHSGIENVICCITDEMHVKQFMGRCRFDVKNLIVVYRHHPSDNSHRDSYIAESHRKFANYVRDKSNREWFESIQDVVDCEFEDVERYRLDPEPERFQSWVNKMWLCGNDPEEEKRRRIYTYDYDTLTDYAYDCRLFGSDKERYTFAAVCRYMVDILGYRIETRRTLVGGERKMSYKNIYR